MMAHSSDSRSTTCGRHVGISTKRIGRDLAGAACVRSRPTKGV